MKYYLICDCRENFKNYTPKNDVTSLYNDHPSMNNMREILSSMLDLGYDCEYFGGIPELIHAVDTHMNFENCRFINFTDGMDQNYSRVQAPALLDILNVPYSGSGVFASALMNNKHYCKQALLSHNISMPRSYIINKHIPFSESMILSWSYPIFVKPNCEGSSLGISQQNVCHTYNELCRMIQYLLNEFSEIIIEEYISGIDITNYLIGNSSHYLINDIVIAELMDPSPYAIYGLNEKHKKLRTLFLNNEKLDYAVSQQINETSINIANIVGAYDICRIDYRYNFENNKYYFLEINSAPRFSTSSEIGFIAKKKNISFATMLNLYVSTFNERIDNSNI